MTTLTSTDRIEKRISLDSPRSRVWRALTDAREFGTWFGVALDGTFAPGANVCGRITIPGHTHCIFDAVVEAMEPERCFSFRWHPYAVDPNVDYSKEPRTLVEFTLVGRGGRRYELPASADQRYRSGIFHRVAAPCPTAEPRFR